MFNYPDGNLAGLVQNELGQGPWAQTGTVATSPIQLIGGRVQLGTTGQDVYAAFGSPLTVLDGESMFVGLTINVASAQAAGDYFFHLSNPAGTTTLYYSRLFARSSAGGFELGFLDTSGTGSTTTWGTTSLSLNTGYRVVLAQNFVAGPVNNRFSIYVDPTDSTIEANNTPYLTHTWTSVNTEPTAYAAVNLRQGTASSAPVLSLDDIAVSQTFADVTVVVPEPSPLVLVLFGGLLTFALVRRNN